MSKYKLKKKRALRVARVYFRGVLPGSMEFVAMIPGMRVVSSLTLYLSALLCASSETSELA